MRWTRCPLLAAALLIAVSPVIQATEQSPLLSAMETELDRSFAALHSADEVPLYYLSYHVTDEQKRNVTASYGAITKEAETRSRILAIDCRVGTHAFDNTHEIRGEFDFSRFNTSSPHLPLEDDELAIRTIIWKATDDAYKTALERYTKATTNEQVLVEKEDTSADFSIEQPNQFSGETVETTFDVESWKEKLRRWSAIFKEYSFIQSSSVRLAVTDDNRYFVDSDGARIQTGESYTRLSLRCWAIAEDGMRLDRIETFDSDTPDGLPDDTEVVTNINRLIEELRVLLDAPLAEPYTGPAILVNRASGVFFHEIFGHRIEGHRQKSEMEGQTFTRKVGKRILPDFISIYDDPTLRDFGGQFLRGYYKYDDQGVKTSRVSVVEKGILRNFLMSRSPIENFPYSNGHGRCQAGRTVVSRQGNLMIMSENEHPFDTLLAMLAAECRRQDKPYGLIFYDISGGFTSTGRYGPQSFKVIPLLVYRYYADGRPPEAIRGVDIVGTPLSSFDKIIATGDDYAVFNGTCGAESGWVPVSAISPSVLVGQVEIEKKMKAQDKPPILEPPYKPARPDGTF